MIAGSATSIASAALATRYDAGRSGVSRSWRFHPVCRSTAIRVPADSAADMAPNAAMLTMRYAAVLTPLTLLVSPYSLT
jgi:hypothetical protein